MENQPMNNENEISQRKIELEKLEKEYKEKLKQEEANKNSNKEEVLRTKNMTLVMNIERISVMEEFMRTSINSHYNYLLQLAQAGQAIKNLTGYISPEFEKFYAIQVKKFEMANEVLEALIMFRKSM